MKTIKQTNISNTLVIKKSEFITFAVKVSSVDEIKTYLDNLKSLYKDCSHICYAYKLGEVEKCSDNGEPSGTAGKPILNVIKQQNLTNILIAVIRYFGGVKLGAGGLVRAYTDSATTVLEKAEIVEIKKMYNILVHICFDKAFNIYLLSNSGLFNIKSRIGNDFILECEPEKLDESLFEIEKLNAKINYYEVLS